MRVRRSIGSLTAAVLVAVLLGAAPAGAATAVTVTPATGLADGQFVTIHGTGFPAGTFMGACQGVTDATPAINDCGGDTVTATSNAAGEVTFTNYPVRRLMFVPSLGRNVDCGTEPCSIGVAVADDIPGTATYRAITFASGPPPDHQEQPDAMIRRPLTGRLIGQGILGTGGTNQTLLRTVPPGTDWSVAVGTMNLGQLATDITITAPARTSPVAVRHFSGYYDVTSLVNGPGVTFANMLPPPYGSTRFVNVQFRVSPTATVGQTYSVLVRATSDGLVDEVRVGVTVAAPG